MRKLFCTIFIAGVLLIGFTYANNCFRNFHFSKNRNTYYENAKTDNHDQQIPRDGKRCPINCRGQGQHKGECKNPDKGPGYGQGQGR